MSIVDQTRMYLRFAFGLRGFLRDPINAEWSWEVTRHRLAHREKNLLTVAKKCIYENERSPYLKLLRLAGCEYGDFEKMVCSDGIECALHKIREEGVYITIEEFKGRQEVARGGQVFRFRESDFDNPCQAGHLEASSGASRSAGTRTIYDLEHLSETFAAHMILRLDAYDSLDFPIAMWLPIMPGAGPVALLAYAKGGIKLTKWFSPVEKRGLKPSLKNRMGTGYVIHAGRIFGAKLPGPEYVALDDAWMVAEWMADTIKNQRKCCLATYVSAAVRISQAARENDLDLTGAMFSVSSEPFTEAKRKEIEASGASVHPMYAFMEAGIVGLGCANPDVADDTHLLGDSFALTQHRREVPHAEVAVDAYLFSTLLLSAPKVLLNVESGDYGTIDTRSCGCKLEKIGLTTHIHSISGFDKLTGEGMSFLSTDLVRIIEEVLPARFGGISTNYQMMEEEDEMGFTRMSIVISPELGELDEAEVIQTVLAELGRGMDSQRMMAQVWSQARTLRVKRMRPIATARGKLLPLHIQKG